MNDLAHVQDHVRGTLEILNRNGHVLHRLSWDGAPVRIGRAHDNDLVVDDPYVCPHHLQLEIRAGQAVANDLDSLNGSYLGNSKLRQEQLPLGEGVVLQFGHSQLRFHPAGSPVTATLRDTTRLGLLSFLASPWALLGLAVLALLTLYADELLENPAPPEWLTLAEGISYPVIGIFAWAGFWALMNRILSHRSHFPAHLAITFAGVVGLFAVAQLWSLLGFGLDLGALVWWLRWLGRILVMGLVVYAHLRFFGQLSQRRQFAIASFVSLLIFGSTAVGSFIEKTQFSSLPWLDPLLLPPAFQLRSGASVEDFLERAGDLRKKAESDARD
ncbi:MAG TPA: FHA domain-containing protein [Xanthomonadales bacterium]|nr:FHA domain-containing protein [Xanthomonadales bacterium]